MPKVSVITPSYNKEKYIAETIDSLINQSFEDWELIVVDDNSKDSTVKIIEEYIAKDSRIQLFKNETNRGANYSRNFALNKSLGEYVIYLDADDVLGRNCLFDRVKKMQITKSDACVFSLSLFNKVIGDDNRVWNPETKTPLADFLSHKLPWQTMQPIWKREILINLGGYDESFERMQDVEFHTRALFNDKITFSLIDGEPDCFFRIDDERKNFEAKTFLERWVRSSVKYYSKFYSLAKEKGIEGELMGTIYQTFLQIVYQYKIGKITYNDFMNLENSLMSSVKLSGGKKLVYRMGKFMNLNCFRIPGFNWFINLILTV